MSTSANPTPDFQRDQILTAAIRMCGLLEEAQEPSPEQLANASFHFNLALQNLQSVGLILTTAERTSLSLVANQVAYALAADTIDVELGQDDTIGTILASGSSVETQVKTMSRGEYMNIASKSTLTGNPSRAYVEKQGTVSIIFWPVPNSSTITFKYTRVRLLRGGDTGAVTLDIRRTWTLYMTYFVAMGVAFDNSKDGLAMTFKAMADEQRRRCEAGDTQKGNIRLRVGHRARNW
jgi:hypothetical protein